MSRVGLIRAVAAEVSLKDVLGLDRDKTRGYRFIEGFIGS